MQSEALNPMNFPENFDKAEFGKGGTLKFACKGVAGRSNTLSNQIPTGEPAGAGGG
jgi:hypothetical protein